MKRRAAVAVVACLAWLGLPAAPCPGARAPEAPAQPEDPSGSPGLSVGSIAGVAALAGAVGGAGGAASDQRVIGNRVEEHGVIRHVLIQEAFQDNQGIVSLNQEAGNLNNQANIRVLALGRAEASLRDVDLPASATWMDNTLISSGGARENRIANSFGGTAGIVGANQSAGNLNQQANVLVLGMGVISESGMVALGDATLGEVSASNTVVRRGAAGPRADIITDSFGGFRGIAQLNQSSGDLNGTGNFFGLALGVLVLP